MHNHKAKIYLIIKVTIVHTEIMNYQQSLKYRQNLYIAKSAGMDFNLLIWPIK